MKKKLNATLLTFIPTITEAPKAETFTKDVDVRMTADQARAWLGTVKRLREALAPLHDVQSIADYDRINRLEIQLETALANEEAFGVTQGAGVAYVEVSL